MVEFLLARKTDLDALTARVTALEAATMPRGYIDGMILSNNATDAVSDIDVSPGIARSAANDADLLISSAIGKQIDASWASGGTPAAPTGGLSSSLTLTINTWYHVVAGLVSGVVEIGFDTDIGGVNLVADHGFANVRRIGSVRRESSANAQFEQRGDDFMLKNPPLSHDLTNPGASSALIAMLVPSGVSVRARMGVRLADTVTSSVLCYISSPSVNDEGPTQTNGPLYTVISETAKNGIDTLEVWTDTSSQIRYRLSTSAATTILRLTSLGWTDLRGKDAT